MENMRPHLEKFMIEIYAAMDAREAPPPPPPPPPAREFKKFKEVNVMRFVNCTCFRDGQCLHQAAPRAWFGPAVCIEIVRPSDPRIQYGCALRIENEKHKWTAPPPKKL